MSGPAAKADKALEHLDKEIRSTEGALRALNKTTKEVQLNKVLGLDITKQQKANTRSVLDGLRAQRLRLGMQRDEQRETRRGVAEQTRAAIQQERDVARIARNQARMAREAERAFQKAARAAKIENRKVVDSFKDALSDVQSILGTLVTGATTAAAGIAALGASFIVSTAQAVDFGEAQRRNLQQRFGAVEGARQYEVLIEYSNRYGTSLQDTFQRFQQLSRAGFNQNRSLALMQAAGDVEAAMGGQAAQGVLTAISQIRSKGVPQMEELQGQLAEHGINLAGVLGEIGHARGGIDQAQVRQLISSRQVSSDETIAAVMRVIQRDFSHSGPLGSAMADRTGTMAGKIDLITARWEIFKTRVGETAAFEPVNRFLGRVADLMDQNTESGKEFQKTLNDIFKDLFGDLDKQDPGAAFRKLQVAIRETIPMLRDAWTVIKGIGDAIGTVAKVVETVYKIWGYTPIGAAQAAAGRALVSNTLPGVQRESSRSVDDALANQQQHQASASRRAGIWSFLTGVFGGDSVAPTAALAASAGIAPTAPAARVNTLNAGRTVNVSGGINVSVDGLADGTTGEDIGQSVSDRLNRELSSAAASQGGAG